MNEFVKVALSPVKAVFQIVTLQVDFYLIVALVVLTFFISVYFKALEIDGVVALLLAVAAYLLAAVQYYAIPQGAERSANFHQFIQDSLMTSAIVLFLIFAF